MSNIKRPPTVWITQILLAILALVALVRLVLGVAFIIAWAPPRFEASVLFLGLLVLALATIPLVLFAISFWGMLKAKSYGRWLGVLSLALVWAIIIYAQMSRRPSHALKYYDYDYSTQGPGIVVALILLHATFFVLVARLAFARKVAEFFR
jgi:hypothetical protein